jgi:hypothetical protein
MCLPLNFRRVDRSEPQLVANLAPLAARLAVDEASLIRRSSLRTDARSSCGEPLLSAGSAYLASDGRPVSMVRTGLVNPAIRIASGWITLASHPPLKERAAAKRALSA